LGSAQHAMDANSIGSTADRREKLGKSRGKTGAASIKVNGSTLERPISWCSFRRRID
jgi:hypothetical protein